MSPKLNQKYTIHYGLEEYDVSNAKVMFTLNKYLKKKIREKRDHWINKLFFNNFGRLLIS